MQLSISFLTLLMFAPFALAQEVSVESKLKGVQDATDGEMKKESNIFYKGFIQDFASETEEADAKLAKKIRAIGTDQYLALLHKHMDAENFDKMKARIAKVLEAKGDVKLPDGTVLSKNNDTTVMMLKTVSNKIDAINDVEPKPEKLPDSDVVARKLLEDSLAPIRNQFDPLIALAKAVDEINGHRENIKKTGEKIDADTLAETVSHREALVGELDKKSKDVGTSPEVIKNLKDQIALLDRKILAIQKIQVSEKSLLEIKDEAIADVRGSKVIDVLTTASKELGLAEELLKPAAKSAE